MIDEKKEQDDKNAKEDKIEITKNTYISKRKLIITIILTLLFVYGLVALNQKINFFLGNDILVNLAPENRHITMHYAQTQKVGFNLSIQNSAYCKSQCNFEFNDRSRNIKIDSGLVTLGNNSVLSKEYEIKIERQGSGQYFYSFDVNCRSISSALCPALSIEKSKSSFITVNYELSESEKFLKEELRRGLTALLEQLKFADVSYQKMNQKFFTLGRFVNLKKYSQEKSTLEEELNKIKLATENIRSQWPLENYERIKSMYNENFISDLNLISQRIQALEDLINQTVQIHNSISSNLDNTADNLAELEKIQIISQENDPSIRLEFVNITSSVANNTFESYDYVSKEISELDNKIEDTQDALKTRSALSYADLELFNFREDSILCNLKNDCMQKNTIQSIKENSTIFLDVYPNSSIFENSCGRLTELESKFESARQMAPFVSENQNAQNNASAFHRNLIRQVNNTYLDEYLFTIKFASAAIRSEVISVLDQILPSINVSLEQINSSMNLSALLLSRINISDHLKYKRLLENCNEIFSVRKLSAPIIVRNDVNFSTISEINTTVSDNPPICCVFGSCNPCCTDDPCKTNRESFPVILLHGHSFVKDNSPEFSLDAFNKMQVELQKDGFLNAGTVSLYSKNEPLAQGVWGLSGRPITVKVSYYFDAFRQDGKYILIPTKSENIDSYALRLKEIIEIIKQRTNKEKVNIVAHSMGGLVARRYVQIFGSADIDKLVMIATPNNGVSGSTDYFCGIVGENRECRDMSTNSVFINKLNDPANLPKKVSIHNIIGTGCKMKLGDGDGAILAKEAELSYAQNYFVKGTCSFGKTLHTEILDIGKYNETYSILSRILKE